MEQITDINKEIADILKELGLYYEIIGDKYRKETFYNGSDIVRNYKEDIMSGNDIKHIYGIGKSTVEVIDEYLASGKVQRLENLRKEYKEIKEAFDYFKSFYGIGAVKSADLIAKGYRTLSQIWDDKDELLSQHQQDGIFWRNHINVRIPREEMDIINDEISMLFNNNFNWVMAGSYRREEESSGDIDLLIENNGEITMDIIYEILSGYIPTVLAKGTKKLAGIFRLSNEYYGHRIDILIVEPENWPFALLHFTGSWKFNKLMRDRAKSFGWKLSEYSLLDLENKTKIPANDEKDIFVALKVKYLEPIQRTKILSSLEFY